MLAVVITLLTEVPGFRDLLLRYPELLVLQVGGVVLIAKFLNVRLLEWMNPPVKKRRARRKPVAEETAPPMRTDP